MIYDDEDDEEDDIEDEEDEIENEGDDEVDDNIILDPKIWDNTNVRKKKISEKKTR